MKMISLFVPALFLAVGLGAAPAAVEPPAYTTTASGLKYVITQHGSGAAPQAGQVVLAHYTGTLADGTVFDSSRDRAQPFAFTLSRPAAADGAGEIKPQVITGWDEGFRLLHVGDHAIFVIPPALAYGDKPLEKIPAGSTLTFDVELVDLKDHALADLLKETIDTMGLAAGQKRFDELKTDKSSVFYIDESQFNALGYRYLTKGKAAEGLAVLQWNVELFPTSANVYDSLGEGYVDAGQREPAMKNYAKSLELDPKNKNAEKMLAELKDTADSPAALATMQERVQLDDLLDADFDAQQADKPVDLVALRTMLDVFLTKNPTAPEGGELVSNYFYLLEAINLQQAKTEWESFLHDPNPKVRDAAEKKMKLAEALKVPVEMKFTAIDGREVDLAKLRGKVVLIDFWATWCGPCREEIPNVVATYGKLHEQGFEIVGITFDQAVDAAKPAKRQKTAEQVAAFTHDHAMTWPQYYDGKYWANPYGQQYGIQGIPAMFLLDKSGMIVSTNARGPKLEQNVRQLLAAEEMKAKQ